MTPTQVPIAGNGAGGIPGLTGSAFTVRGRIGSTPIGLNVFIAVVGMMRRSNFASACTSSSVLAPGVSPQPMTGLTL